MVNTIGATIETLVAVALVIDGLSLFIKIVLSVWLKENSQMNLPTNRLSSLDNVAKQSFLPCQLSNS